jgi:23S rRNA pseudouridine2605 synthase
VNRPPRKPRRPASARPASRRGPVRKRSASAGDPQPGERLQKVLAAAGLGSRRQCEEFIRDGRVDVDGKTVTELGTRVNPFEHEIRVDGVRLAREEPGYFAVNKPVGVVTTNHDPAGRTRVVDLVRSRQRLFPVGRLDRSSEGLILLTNDGDFANRLAHPRYGVEKTYRVIVAGHPAPESLQRLLKGVHLAEGVARVASIRMRSRRHQSTELEIVLTEGRNREIRRLLARIGHKVLRLRRIAIGPLRLGELPVGSFRKLTHREIDALRKASDASRRSSRSTPDAAAKPTASKPTDSKRSSSKPSASKPSASKPSASKPFSPGTPGSDDLGDAYEDLRDEGLSAADDGVASGRAGEEWIEIPWEPAGEGLVLGLDDERPTGAAPRKRFGAGGTKGKGRGNPRRGRPAPAGRPKKPGQRGKRGKNDNR